MHTSTRRTPRWARVYVIAITLIASLFTLSPAVGLLAEPAGFARLVNFPYGVHYLHDAGAFQLGIGATLLLALVCRDTLAVVLGGFLAGNTAHALVHAADRGLGGHPSDPYLLGVLSLLTLAALGLRLADLRTLHHALVPVTAGGSPVASAGDEVDGRASDRGLGAGGGDRLAAAEPDQRLPLVRG